MASKKVSRLPALPDPLPAEIEAQFAERLAKTGRILNLHHMVSHAPAQANASMQMAMSLRSQTDTPRLYIELAIVRSVQIADGHYELKQHLPMLLAAGLSQAKIDGLEAWRSSDLFDPKERAVLAYAEGVADRGNVSDAAFADLEAYFTPQQIMELTYAAGSYYGTALITNALRLQPEP